MAKASGTASSPPAATTPALKRSTSSTQNMKNQRSILGFFQKSSPATPTTARKDAATAEPASSPAQRAADTRSSVKAKNRKAAAPNLTPAPSSDAVDPEENGLGLEEVCSMMIGISTIQS